MLKKILILLATCNGEKYIHQQLDSIKNQKQVDIDVLVSDDKSSDKTVEIIKAYSDEMNIKILKTYSSNSRNFSLNFYHLISESDATAYDYVAYSDQDDIFVDTKYIEMINLLENNNAMGGSSSVKCFGASDSILRQSKMMTKYDYLFEGAGQGNTFVLKKELFSKFQAFVRGYRTELDDFVYHDWLTYLFCRSKGYTWHFNNNPLSLYRIHYSNHTGSKKSFTGIVMRLKKLFNGWYYEQILIANKLSRIINKNIVDLENISTFKLLHILIFNGRRKLSERAISLVGIIFSRFTSRK